MGNSHDQGADTDTGSDLGTDGIDRRRGSSDPYLTANGVVRETISSSATDLRGISRVELEGRHVADPYRDC